MRTLPPSFARAFGSGHELLIMYVRVSLCYLCMYRAVHGWLAARRDERWCQGLRGDWGMGTAWDRGISSKNIEATGFSDNTR